MRAEVWGRLGLFRRNAASRLSFFGPQYTAVRSFQSRPDSESKEFRINVDDSVHVSVKILGGQPRVDIRKWFKSDKNGDWLPTTKGINLTVSQFKRLIEHQDQILQHLKSLEKSDIFHE